MSCFLHKKPNKNCKKCQSALLELNAAQAAEASAKEASKQKVVEAMEDKIRRRNDASGESFGEKKSIQCSPMLKEQIMQFSYFKSLMDVNTVEALIHEIVAYADNLDVYNAGTKTIPSCFMCQIYRLSLLPNIESELSMLIDNRNYAMVRCVGFLYLRFVTPPTELEDVLEEYLLDDMELKYQQGDGTDVTTTIGEYVESLLTQDKYFDSPLPRLPIKVRQNVEEKVAPMWQHRKRSQANRRALTVDNVMDTPVEVCMNGTWLKGKAKELFRKVPSRIKVLVELDNGIDVKVHLGKIVIVDSQVDHEQGDNGRRRERSRSRSRGDGSPDWSRCKGKSDADMLQELRERHRQNAVAQGKDYAKKTRSFCASMHATSAAEVNTWQDKAQREQLEASVQPISKKVEVMAGGSGPFVYKRRTQEQSDRDDELDRRRLEEEGERQRKLASVYKKYGEGGSSSQNVNKKSDREGPDYLTLG